MTVAKQEMPPIDTKSMSADEKSHYLESFAELLEKHAKNGTYPTEMTWLYNMRNVLRIIALRKVATHTCKCGRKFNL